MGGNMKPLLTAALKQFGGVAIEWWLKNRPFSKEKREARKLRRARRKAGLPPLEESSMEKQVLQGGVTFAGLGVALSAYLLDKFDLTSPVCTAINIDGCNATLVVTFVLGIATAAYGRVRREFRKDGT